MHAVCGKTHIVVHTPKNGNPMEKQIENAWKLRAYRETYALGILFWWLLPKTLNPKLTSCREGMEGGISIPKVDPI